MWKIEHPGGQREIDALHVPVGKTVRLVLASQDVIHSFFIPAFRIKHDVVPGTYETLWFKATKTGDYRLECSELCGTQHAQMIGRVFVMEPAAYAHWLVDQGVSQSLAQQGDALFRQHGCSGCHSAQQHRPRALAGRRLRQPRAPSGRVDDQSGRTLHPRLHPAAANLHRRRLPADHAVLFRTIRARTIWPNWSHTSNPSADRNSVNGGYRG